MTWMFIKMEDFDMFQPNHSVRAPHFSQKQVTGSPLISWA